MPTYIWFFIAAGLMAVVWLSVAWYFRSRDGKWREADVDQMRRWKDGRWEYRPMTEQERSEKQENEAW